MHYESAIISGDFSKSPTTSSLQDSSMDVVGSEEDSAGVGVVGGQTIVETSGLTVVTMEEGESMVLDSGQVLYT